MDKLEGLVKIQKSNERMSELVQYKNGIEIKRYDQCYLHSIIPNDWVSPYQENKKKMAEIQKQIQSNKQEILILYKLIEKEQKQYEDQQLNEIWITLLISLLVIILSWIHFSLYSIS